VVHAPMSRLEAKATPGNLKIRWRENFASDDASMSSTTPPLRRNEAIARICENPVIFWSYCWSYCWSAPACTAAIQLAHDLRLPQGQLFQGEGREEL
jgi:hypothetical protein